MGKLLKLSQTETFYSQNQNKIFIIRQNRNGSTCNIKYLIHAFGLEISTPLYESMTKTYLNTSLGSWREFGCRDDAKAWRKSTKEADKHKNFLLQFRK